MRRTNSGSFVHRIFLSLALAVLAGHSIVHADAPAAAVAVDIGGEIAKPLHLSTADLTKLPHTRLHAKAHDIEADWDGVPLIDLLRTAGAPIGDALRGPNLKLYVRISAADGYRAVFSLAELDPGIGGAVAILADRRDGKPMDDKEGPLRIIVPADKRPARWVRQVVAIDLLRSP